MNLQNKSSGSLGRLMFRFSRVLAYIVPGGRISAFGGDGSKIGSIIIVNLDRQPQRWRRMLRELSRFRTSEGAPLTSIIRRFAAVDARDGRAVAATADVDTTYFIGDQLYVQPDVRLAECFDVKEPVRMTRQEVAVARSHIEVWKAIATGTDDYVLVLEDDVWFRRGAVVEINRGWCAALQRCHDNGGPRLLYLSYADADGTVERVDLCDSLFRPVRGLWFLSGYVLSREGAAALLRAMPVIGPVDLWINYRFEELGALALSSPAILQRQDEGSDNSYSILPYLARAGIVDAGSGPMSLDQTPVGPLLAWTAGGEYEELSMALSMLGLRVRVFDGDEPAILAEDLPKLFEVFDALINAPFAPSAVSAAIDRVDTKFLFEANAAHKSNLALNGIPSSRTAVLPSEGLDSKSWRPICALLGLDEPAENFPIGAPRKLRLFRDDRPNAVRQTAPVIGRNRSALDDSPWVLPPLSGWQQTTPSIQKLPVAGDRIIHAAMTTASSALPRLTETFPGNQASFVQEGLIHDETGAHLTVSKVATGTRLYRSGAFASKRSFEYGRFEAEIRAASGDGLITGFFLHRDTPRQEIDIEFSGNDPRQMLVNVYFNPGDDGASFGFGYRGSPCRIDLGFDASTDFHLYAIDWRPGRIAWSVDGKVVHERLSWNPTPIPHLPMRLHANLWVPNSEELAGRLNENALPASAVFRNVSVRA